MTSPEDDKEKENSYAVGFAKAEIDGLFAPDELMTALKDSWNAGAEVTRYNRHWTLSRMVNSDENGVYGKIGFVAADELETLTFDRTSLDFVHGQASSGVVVPFFISHDGLVTYQLIAGVVRENTFIHALQDLLNSNERQFYTWQISPLTYEIQYDDWRQSVDRVVRFDLRLERPNPNYHGDKIAEDLVEGLVAEYVRLTGVQREGGSGIDTDSDTFRQALDHVLRDYGKATLTGVEPDGAQSVWVKAKNAAARIAARVRVTAVGGSEVPERALRTALELLPTSASTALLQPDEEAVAGG